MRRRNVSPEELAKIINLRQSNTSWLKIQRDTGVPRRIAKIAYEQWGRSQSQEELKEARKKVAAEEFRLHMECLIKLAQSLVNFIDLPKPINDPIKAKDVLQNLWKNDILKEYGVYGMLEPNRQRQFHRSDIYFHQNILLFESLKAHSQEKIKWQILDNWKNAWDKCIELLNKLKVKVDQELTNFLEQKSKLRDKIFAEFGKQKAIQHMANGIIDMLWQHILHPDQQFPLVKDRTIGGGRSDITFGEHQLTVNLTFSDPNVAKEIVSICASVAKNLDISRKEGIMELDEEINIMQKSIEYLSNNLNPIILKPLILRTRCDLCPA